MNTYTRSEAMQQEQAVHHSLLRASLVMALLTLLGFGMLYSLTGAALGQLLFPWQAAGSIVEVGGKPVASAWVAQAWNAPRYLQPRPSGVAYDPMAAGGSNQARSNPELIARIARTRAEVAARDGVAPAQVAADLVTISGSGMDPEISPQAAEQQVARIARARGVAPDEVRLAIRDATSGKQFGVLGHSRVNVLRANLALDALN